MEVSTAKLTTFCNRKAVSILPSTPQIPLKNLEVARVLILNASYVPLHVCSVKRAVSLIMHKVAERVEDAERVLRSPNAVFPVPSVIRLKRYVSMPTSHRVSFNRKNVFRRDDFTCQYCGSQNNHLTLDHVIPRSRGGITTWTNVVACCIDCNARKRDRTPQEANMKINKQPSTPRFFFTCSYGFLPDLDPIWNKYLPRV